MVRITNRTCLYRQLEEIRGGFPKLNRPMGLQPSSHTPKLNQIEADQSQPKNQGPVSGPICNHRASGQASRPNTVLKLVQRRRRWANTRICYRYTLYLANDGRMLQQQS